MKLNPASFLKSTRAKLLVMAIALGAIATLLVQTYVNNIIERFTGGQSQLVVIASKTIEPGVPIATSDLGAKAVPSDFISKRSVLESEKEALLEQKTNFQIKAGQFVFWDDIVLESQNSLSDNLDINERALTLNVSNTNSFNSMLEPGDRIDILLLEQKGGLKSVPSLTPVLQNVFVLATNDNLIRKITIPTATGGQTVVKNRASDEAITTITVRLTTEEALALAYAQANGALTFLLRNRIDAFTAELPSISEDAERESTEDKTVAKLNRLEFIDTNKRIESYPIIFEEGKPSRSGYYPSELMVQNELRINGSQDFEKRVTLVDNTNLTDDLSQ